MAQFILFAVPANMELGPATPQAPATDRRNALSHRGRLQRALNNHFEGLILFTIAVVVITLSDQSTPSPPPAPGPTSARGSSTSPPMPSAGALALGHLGRGLVRNPRLMLLAALI
jgi:hypothetical protein